MKLETLEKYLNKDQKFWSRADLEKLVGRYGEHSIFRETEGITNKLFNLFKYRYEAENDKVISDFLIKKNNEFEYVIKFIIGYLDYVDYIYWSIEEKLHVIYKILCRRLLETPDFKNTKYYDKMNELVEKIKNIKEHSSENILRTEE